MEWNVYYYDINRKQITTFNIFRHGGFREDVQEYLRTYNDKTEFAEAVKRELFYYFGNKAEWELIIRLTNDNRVFLLPWVGSKDPEKEKIEICPNVNFKWRDFAEQMVNKQIYKNDAKIDVYNQVMYAYTDFINYCWDYKTQEMINNTKCKR